MDMWFRHPVIGDASFDTFKRSPANPVHRGSPPYEWPVNCSIFRDPVSGFLYLYVSQYPKGYWHVSFSLNSMAYESRDNGQTWESLGVVLEGTTNGYDSVQGKKGSVTDLSVVYDQGIYHAVAGWVCSGNTDGGIAYASAPSPRGPFRIGTIPLHTESEQSPLFGLYTRAYAASLVKRKSDWLILAMMSTKFNAGGTWALAAMTSDRPEGPYTAPVPVIYPQSMQYHPPVMENFSYIEQGKDIFLPFTSVALNRNFNIVYKVNREKAHNPGAWELYKHGSVWHSEDLDYERKGIWGQNFSAVLDEDGKLVAAYPAKDSDDLGTINIARCRWNKIDRGNGFFISAPNGPGMTFIRRDYEAFELIAELDSNQKKVIFWGHNSALGSDGTSADVSIHPYSLLGMARFEYHEGEWRLVRIHAQGSIFEIANGLYDFTAGMTEMIRISCAYDITNIYIHGKEVWSGKMEIVRGRVGVLAETGCYVRVNRFEMDSPGMECMLSYLCTEGLSGAGEGYHTTERWTKRDSSLFRFGTAFKTDRPGAICKWNYFGGDFRLWSPRGPELGCAEVYVDGRLIETIDMMNDMDIPSSPVFTSRGVERGYHAVVEKLINRELVCDSFDFNV